MEQPGRIWATLPAENAIIRLVVTSPGVYDVNTYQLPTASSQPYDIAYAAGAVWVTEHIGNKIARFDPLTESWTEYPIPTVDSRPTGLVVLPGNPVQVWFCQQVGNKLGRLRIAETGISEFDEFPLPWAGAMMESVAAVSGETVWFTAPGVQRIARFALSRWLDPVPGNPDPGGAFGFAYTGVGSKPFQIKLDTEGLPWFTEPSSNRIGRFNPGTITIFEWYPVPTPDSGLAGIDVALGYAWFTERGSDRLGRLRRIAFSAQVSELPLPSAHAMPTDIAVDLDGCAWSAASGTDQIISWCPPYFRIVYLPIILRAQ